MPRGSRTTRHLRPAALVLALAATATGCFTGERPVLLDRPQIDDPAAQAVLDRLGLASSLDFAATYEITPTNATEPTVATVVQSGGNRRVTIGTVTYLVDGTVVRTCQNDDQGCVDFIDDARVSDLQITHRFWGDAFASRLELDASRRIGFSAAGNAIIADYPAACVDIPIPSTRDLSGAVQYCALDAGVLARYVGADVKVELTEFELDPTDPDL